jgi:hypothetical protein
MAGFDLRQAQGRSVGVSHASLTAEPRANAIGWGLLCLGAMFMRGTQWLESDAKVTLVIVGAFAVAMLLLVGGAFFL